MNVTKKRLIRLINEQLERFLLETVDDQKLGQPFNYLKFNTLFATGFDGILQIIEIAEAFGFEMSRVYSFISKKLYNLENEVDIVMGYFNYDYEGLLRLFANLTENFGDDFFDSRVRHKAVGTFSAINRELQIIDSDYNGNREVTDLDYSTFRQATSSPQKRAANRGEYIIDDIAEAFENLAANTKKDFIIKEKKNTKNAEEKMKLTRKQLRNLMLESINEAHGLSDDDVEYLQNYIKIHDEQRLKKILKHLIRSNVAVIGKKSVNVAKNPKKIRKKGKKK